MTKPQAIRNNLSLYISSIIWVQEWGIQDPMKQQPTINNKTYPPNVSTELPIEQLEIVTSDFSSTSTPNQLTCRAKFPFRITYVFNRNNYQSFRSLPISQIENLLFKASQLILLFANRIDSDIISVSIPAQTNPIIVRVADDIKSDKASSLDWVITAKLDIDVEFVSSPSEFIHDDYKDIQPPTFTHPDGQPMPDTSFNEFDLNQLRIEVNRSELPNVRTDDETTYKLDEIIILNKDS